MVTCDCCDPGSAQIQLSPSWSRVHPRVHVPCLAAGSSQGFMAPSSAGIGCAWHTLRLLQEVSPLFPLSQFSFIQPLLTQHLLSLGSLKDTQHWDFASHGP